MRRVLVTGGTGCIGQHVVPMLNERGFEVHAISSSPQQTGAQGVTWHRADLLDRQQMEVVVHDVRASHLLHLAWHVAPGYLSAIPENLAWVRSSLDLLEAFRMAGGRRVVCAGTCMEYDWNYGYCSEARTPCMPHTMYGASKHALQMLTAGVGSNQSDMTTAWGRIFFLYGPYERESRLVASVIRSLLAGKPAKCSHGKQIRDYLFAGDVADAFVALLESNVTGPVNIGSGRPVAIKDIVLETGRLVGRSDLIELGALPAATTDLPLVVADTTRLENMLGWRPKHDLTSGLKLTIELVRHPLATRMETAV